MAEYLYIGVMDPVTSSDKFLTSIFIDDSGNYYTQEDDDNEIIIKFQPINLSRNIKRAEKLLSVSVGDEFVYSYQASSQEKIISGKREDIEVSLLGLLNSETITVHARLMISSFLKLYQKSIELVELSNKNLLKNNFEQQIDPNIVFANKNEKIETSHDLLEKIRERLHLFKSVDSTIRINDIAYLNRGKAFFVNHQLNLELIANNKSLSDERQKKLVSKLITSCVEHNREVIHMLLFGHTETYDFVLKSEFVSINEDELNFYLGAQEKTQKSEDRTSLIDSIITLNKEIGNESNVVRPLEKRDNELNLDKSISQILDRYTADK